MRPPADPEPRVLTQPAVSERLAAGADAGPAHRRRRDLRVLLVLLAVAVVALIPRLMLAHQTLPYIDHPDEPSNVGLGERMQASGSWLPGRYSYPSLLFDVLAVLSKLYVLVRSPIDASSLTHTQNAGVVLTLYPGLFLAARLVSVLVSLVLCLAVAEAVRRATGRPVIGLAAGMLVALSPLGLENAVLITPDVYAGAGSALALAGALAILRNRSWWVCLLAGAGAGLAAGAKYNAGLVLLAVLAAVLLQFWRDGIPKLVARLTVSAAATMVAFIVTTPAVLADPHQVWAGIRFEMGHYGRGQAGFEGATPQFYAGSLIHGDLLILLLALVGVVGGLIWARRRTIVLLAFAVPYLGLICSQRVHFARNLMPLLPALAILAGFGLVTLADRLLPLLSARWRPSRKALRAVVSLAVAVVVLGLGLNLARDVGHERNTLEQPSKVLARQWLVTHLPPDSRVELEAYGPYLDGFQLQEVPFVALSPPLPGTRALVVTDRAGGRFIADPRRYPDRAAAYQRLFANYCDAAFFDRGPWIRILVPCEAKPGRTGWAQ